ncbi:MAG: Xaa-Pro peptidase family protein, partial [Pseudomonadota bacterium]|nr:Xaa-Pro peptidase family protein [Pseudomonadota bacterium]
MTQSKAPFSTAEYERRLAKTRAAMAEAGLDALFVTDPSNQAWLTGYDGWSFYVHQGVIVTMEGEPIWWGRYMDMMGGRRTCWMDHTNILGYGDHFVQSTVVHPMQDLAEQLKTRGFTAARIGVEMENYYYSAKAHAVLTDELPEAALIDATALVNWQRLVKSDVEVDFIRKAARITEKVMLTAIDRAAPGVRKNDVVADIMKAGIEGIGDDWGDYPAIVPLTPSGLDATAAHLTWDGTPMHAGEATFFELSGCYRRYHAPISRTVFLGTPSDDMLRAEAAQLEGIAAG